MQYTQMANYNMHKVIEMKTEIANQRILPSRQVGGTTAVWATNSDQAEIAVYQAHTHGRLPPWTTGIASAPFHVPNPLPPENQQFSIKKIFDIMWSNYEDDYTSADYYMPLRDVRSYHPNVDALPMYMWIRDRMPGDTGNQSHYGNMAPRRYSDRYPANMPVPGFHAKVDMPWRTMLEQELPIDMETTDTLAYNKPPEAWNAQISGINYYSPICAMSDTGAQASFYNVGDIRSEVGKGGRTKANPKRHKDTTWAMAVVVPRFPGVDEFPHNDLIFEFNTTLRVVVSNGDNLWEPVRRKDGTYNNLKRYVTDGQRFQRLQPSSNILTVPNQGMLGTNDRVGPYTLTDLPNYRPIEVDTRDIVASTSHEGRDPEPDVFSRPAMIVPPPKRQRRVIAAQVDSGDETE